MIINVAGEGETTPLDLAGGGVSNPSFDPTKLQFVYGGTGNIKITGGTETAALVYAPNASASLPGASTHFYGAIVTNKITSTGGFNLYLRSPAEEFHDDGGQPDNEHFQLADFLSARARPLVTPSPSADPRRRGVRVIVPSRT